MPSWSMDQTQQRIFAIDMHLAPVNMTTIDNYHLISESVWDRVHIVAETGYSTPECSAMTCHARRKYSNHDYIKPDGTQTLWQRFVTARRSGPLAVRNGEKSAKADKCRQKYKSRWNTVKSDSQQFGQIPRWRHAAFVSNLKSAGSAKISIFEVFPISSRNNSEMLSIFRFYYNNFDKIKSKRTSANKLLTCRRCPFFITTTILTHWPHGAPFSMSLLLCC